jgi:hypothetical protein
MPDFTIGQRVTSVPGLHWLKQRVTGTVIDVNASCIIVLLDFPCSRSGSRDKRRLSFSRKNLEHA